MSITLMKNKRYSYNTLTVGTNRGFRSRCVVRDNGIVPYLIGEWIPAWLWMSMTFLVAALGVAGLGFWVLRGDARNRQAEEAAEQTHEHE